MFEARICLGYRGRTEFFQPTGTVGWVPPIHRFSIDKPSEFASLVRAFVPELCIRFKSVSRTESV